MAESSSGPPDSENRQHRRADGISTLTVMPTASCTEPCMWKVLDLGSQDIEGPRDFQFISFVEKNVLLFLP